MLVQQNDGRGPHLGLGRFHFRIGNHDDAVARLGKAGGGTIDAEGPAAAPAIVLPEPEALAPGLQAAPLETASARANETVARPRRSKLLPS